MRAVKNTTGENKRLYSSLKASELLKGASEEDEDDEGSSGSEFVSYAVRKKSFSCLRLDIDETVQQPKAYRPFIAHLDTLEEGDRAEIHFTTYGGSYDGAIALINAIENTKADVIAYISGRAISAGSLIALSCPNIVVSPYGSLLCHTAKYGSAGTVLNNQKWSAFEQKQIHNVLDSVYQGFLTADEIKRMFAGEDFLFNAKEIGQRLTKKFKAAAKAEKAQKTVGTPRSAGIVGSGPVSGITPKR